MPRRRQPARLCFREARNDSLTQGRPNRCPHLGPGKWGKFAVISARRLSSRVMVLAMPLVAARENTERYWPMAGIAG